MGRVLLLKVVYGLLYCGAWNCRNELCSVYICGLRVIRENINSRRKRCAPAALLRKIIFRFNSYKKKAISIKSLMIYLTENFNHWNSGKSNGSAVCNVGVQRN